MKTRQPFTMAGIGILIALNSSGCGSDTVTQNDTPNPAATGAATHNATNGTWASSDGKYFAVVTNSGTNFSLGCAKGSTSQPFVLDSRSQSSLAGIYVIVGGPVTVGPRQFDATYAATFAGKVMSLNVSYTDGNGDAQSDTYELTLGAPIDTSVVCALGNS